MTELTHAAPSPAKGLWWILWRRRCRAGLSRPSRMLGACPWSVGG